MKARLAAVAIAASCAVAEATTFNTIVGPPGGPPLPPFGFVADELFPTSTSGRTFHATWDATHIYLAQTGEPVNPFHQPARSLVWYFDTDPQPAPLSGAGTATAMSFGTQGWTLPFRADYAFVVTTQLGGLGLYRWTGSAWVLQTAGPSWAQSVAAMDPYLKVGVFRGALGNPTAIYALGFIVSAETGNERTYASWPSDALLGGDGYYTAGQFVHWLGWNLVNGISPNDPSFHDPTYPVELMGFSVE